LKPSRVLNPLNSYLVWVILCLSNLEN